MATIFISDLHLTSSRPDITHCFFEFMSNEAVHTDALYVLGDLFEFWIGDDDNSPFNQTIKAAFKELTDSGVPCYFIQGNRDFLIGKRFAAETRITLLEEVCAIDLYDERAVILHGDTLCTDDVSYQVYRAKVHQPWLQWLYNRLPLMLKKKIAFKVQSNIGAEKKEKSLDIMDVNQSAVESVLNKYNARLMIHGHTHRPDIHYFQLRRDFESESSRCTRIVLGDWYKQGSILIFEKGSYELKNKPLVPLV